jgi:hypothetical protein
VITLFRCSLVAFVCAGAACSASYPTEPTNPKPLALIVQYATPRGKVVPGTAAANTYTFTAFTLNGDNVSENVTSKVAWRSSDPGVAQVRPGATFVAVAPGEARAIATYEGLEASAAMVVIDAQVLARLVPRLEVTATGPLQVGGPPARATANSRTLSTSSGQVVSTSVTNRVEWTSSDTNVATVDGNGFITPTGMGTALIRASMDGVVDWIWVSVAPPS